MLFAELIPLTAALRDAGRHITIETAGTLHLPVACDLMSISPKLSNSTPAAERAGAWRERHQRSRHVPTVIARLIAEYQHQLKFVVGTPADADEVLSYLERFRQIDRTRAMLMPEGVDQPTLAAVGQWLAPFCQAHGLQFCPRRQIEWFGLMRGT